MQSKRITLACLLSIFLAVSMLNGCSETATPGNQIEDSSSEGSLAQRSKVRPRATGAWASPQLVGSASLQNAATSYLHGPFISATDFGSSFIRWRTHTDLNPFTGEYINGVTAVLSQSNFGVWQAQSPVPPFSQARSTLPDIVVDNVNGQAYAVWVQDNIVYASVYNNLSQWSAPSQIGQGNQAWLVKGNQGNIAAVWVRENGPNQFVIEAKRNQNASNWSQVFSLQRSGRFVNTTRPVMDVTNQVIVAWQEEQAGTRGIFSATLSSFGWNSAVTVRPSQPLGAELIAAFEIAAGGQNGGAQLIVHVTDSISGDGLFAYTYLQNLWSSAQNIDDNVFNSDRTQLEPFALASDVNGNMLVAWVEEQRDNVATYSIVFASRFTPLQGWSLPEPISAPVFRGPIGTPPPGLIPTYLNNLDAVVDSNGEITVAWVENSPQTSELFTAHYMAQSGWAMPQLVVAYPGSEVIAEEPDLALRANSPVITWRRATRNSQGVFYEIFYASNSGGPGSVVTPIPIDPTQPKPVGHIASTNDCFACHFPSGVTIVNHGQVIGTCESCHQKTAFHMPTTNFCASCHMTTAWRPVLTVDHNQVQGACLNCHDGVTATGKGPFHIPSSDQCEACHTTQNWFTTTTQPGNPGVGVITPTTPKPVTHIPTTDQCFSCHINGSPIVRVVDHSQVIGTCSSCHNNIVALGKSIAHIQSTDRCDACHTTVQFVPAVTIDHVELIGSCFSCHNGVLATGKSATHIPSSNQCEQCHSITAWRPASGGTPINAGPTGDWSTPVNVWSNTSVNSSNDYVHGPQLKATSNNVFVSLVKHSRFNGFTGRYELAQNHLFYSSSGTAWREVLPAPLAEMLNATMVQVQVSAQTGRAYALWSKQGELFFSEGTNQGTWAAPQKIGDVDGQYHLLLNNEILTAVWRNSLGPNRVQMNARVYQTGLIWGETRSMEVSESAQFSEPVVDTQGRVFVGRQELLQNTRGGLSLFVYVNDFTQATGWSVDTELPVLPVEITVPITLEIAATGQGQVFALAGVNGVVGFNDSGLYAWSPGNPFGWQNLITQPNSLSGKPKLVASPLGEAMAVWVQAQNLTPGRQTYQVFSSRFNPSVSRWESGVRLGNFADSYETDPTIFMRANGEAVAAWVSDNAGQSVLYTNHYTPFVGWGSVPQSVVVNQLALNGYTVTPDIAETPLGEYYIAWKQVLIDQANTEYSIWVSQSASQPF